MLTTVTNIKRGSQSSKPTTQATSHEFNSYCNMRGESLACGDGGLYVIGADDFDGTAIAAYAITSGNDLGYPGLKRLRFASFEVYTEGQVNIIPIVDGVEYGAKKVVTGNGWKYVRIPVGRNMQGNFYSFKIENVDGCDFSIGMADVEPILLSRGRSS